MEDILLCQLIENRLFNFSKQTDPKNIPKTSVRTVNVVKKKK